MSIELSKVDGEIIAVRFPYEEAIVLKVRQIPGRRWLPEERVWTFPYTLANIERFNELFAGCDVEVGEDLRVECELLQVWDRKGLAGENGNVTRLGRTVVFAWDQTTKRQLTDNLRARGYSRKTIKAYCGQVNRFHRYLSSSEALSGEKMQSYCLYLLNRHRSHSYVNQAVSAIKFFIQMSRVNQLWTSNMFDRRRSRSCPACFQRGRYADFWKRCEIETSSDAVLGLFIRSAGG